MKSTLLALVLIKFTVFFTFVPQSHAQPEREKTLRALKGAAVGAVAYFAGNVARDWAGPDRSLFSAPIGPDRFLRRVFYQPGKTTNWLDANGVYYLIFAGLAVTAGTPVMQTSTINLYDIGYDVAAYSSGILLTGGLTRIIKGVVSRPRPYAYFGTRPIPEDTSEAYRSFVSGHASIAFYIADFLHLRLNDALGHPAGARQTMLSVLLYGMATYTAYSRMQIDQHYFTDVVAGALLGIAVARLTHAWFFPDGASSNSRAASITPGPGLIRLSIAF